MRPQARGRCNAAQEAYVQDKPVPCMPKVSSLHEALERLRSSEVADNARVRSALWGRLFAGELTLTQAKDQLEAIKRAARAEGREVWGR
jgi:hypothetical protein